MNLMQLEKSSWITLKANKMHNEICIFSVESIKIMGSWYVMQWCLTRMYHHLGGT